MSDDDAFGPRIAVMGRPSGYTDEIAETIIDEITAGATLRQVAAMPGMPVTKTIMRWVVRYKEFREQYEQALIWRAVAHNDECIDIARDGSKDLKDTSGPDDAGPVLSIDKDVVARSKLACDEIRKSMAFANPKRWHPNFVRPDPSLEAPRDAADAKNITDQTAMIDLQPLREQLAALRAPTPKQGE